MVFDWIPFLDNYHVPYWTQGSNIGKGWVGVSCPWCGDDYMHHLGINLSHGGFNCWRGDHKGRKPHKLIVELIRCTYEEAERIVNTGSFSSSIYGDLSGRINITSLFSNKEEELILKGTEDINYLPEFRSVHKSALADIWAIPYIMSRGYSYDETIKLSKRHKLLFAQSGQFSYRVIFPITLFGDLVTWTGRTVVKDEDELRYKTLPTNPERAKELGLPCALESTKSCLFDYDRLSKIDKQDGTLVLTEGPFDAVRITYLGKQDNIFGTCTFGMRFTDIQLSLLADLASKFKRKYIICDKFAVTTTLRSMPGWLGFKPKELPDGTKDPAELNRDSFEELFF